jgi:hypothetical protein
MLRVSQLAALLFAFIFSCAALAQDYYGAIAYSPSTGADGWANDHRSQEAAERAALAACSSHANDCRSLFWFKNACGTLAMNPAVKAGWGWGKTQALADGEAMKACRKQAKGCKIKRQLCTAGAR